MGVVRILPVGERACLVEVGDAVAAASLAAWARASGLAADDVVPAATHRPLRRVRPGHGAGGAAALDA